MPFPDLDTYAGNYFKFYDLSESLDISQPDYNKYYKNVADSDHYLKSVMLAFLTLMGIMAVGFIGLLIFYCTVLRKIPDEEDEMK